MRNLTAVCIVPFLLLAACSTNHPGVYAGYTAGSIVGSAVRVNGRHTSEAVYWGGLAGAATGFLGESLAELFSGGDYGGERYVLRVPIIRPSMCYGQRRAEIQIERSVICEPRSNAR